MNAPFVREVELAYRLGFTEMEDFKRALGRGDVPPPTLYLGKGRKRHPLWARNEVDQWMERDSKQTEDQAVADAINAL